MYRLFYINFGNASKFIAQKQGNNISQSSKCMNILTAGDVSLVKMYKHVLSSRSVMFIFIEGNLLNSKLIIKKSSYANTIQNAVCLQ